ncbi:ankyrin domain protein (macronuclear) [Tetrahymena thermophila SB210]|uniref:Ankyrin domain protein n=1 Tax=Tetrahymena thermophila (strain SB210) TaxID=312017 RepID=I7LWV6_TETTS|nr:ankyrin domain protein [Tetrahymena thermophila SB210]EAS02939.2 ankyrin domain protein [Tetrahymena thermophila SB210]|eukprot:XP_001023184.2 ankyrin domain protein [Tetrahymena thermophila SB210]
MKRNKFQMQLDREKMIVIDELLSQKKKGAINNSIKNSTFVNSNGQTNKSSQQKDQPNLNKSAHGFNKSDGNIYIKNFGDHVSSLKHTNQSNNQEISFADKVTQKSKKLERLEQKYERDEYFLNQTIKNKKRELEKVYRVQSQQQLMNYFKLSDAKQENIPHLMSNALDNNSDTSIRQKIREFLGTNFKTDFFDNLDDFVGCVKVLYGNSKIISAKIDRIFKGKQAEDFEDIEKLQMKFVEELRSRPIKLREQERIQRMKQQGTFDTNKSPSLNNFIDKNFSKNQPKGTLPSLANFDPLLLPQNQKYNNQNTIKLEAPQLSYLQNYRFELGDQDTFSKNFQRKNQIGALYRNAQSQFVQVQIDMNQKEEKLQDQCEDFKKVNQQLLEFRQAFRENLQTLNIIKKVKVGKQDQQNGEQKQVKFQEDLTGSGDSLIELKNLIIKQDNSYLLKQLFRQTIWTIILKLKRLKLDYDEIFINNVFPNSPFEREGSRDFFKAVKTNDLEKVQKMLKICKYHVYDFDSTRQTPLHWAARRNFFDVMALICEHGADLEAQDMGGRTPLFHCVIGGDMNSCRMLLARGANPYVKSLAKHKPSHFTENEVIKALLRKAEQLHTMMSLLPLKKRKDFWIRNVSVFSHHSSNQLNDKILNLKQTDLQIE